MKEQCKSFSFLESMCDDLVVMEDAEIEEMFKKEPEEICKDIGMC